MTAYTAYLRVYEPLAAFPEAERRHWEGYVAGDAAVPRAAGPVVERAAGLAAVVPSTRVPEPDQRGGQAHVLRAAGVTLVCPWRTAVRSWQALAEFRAGMPDGLAEAFVPATVAEEAASRLETWLRDNPDARVHVQTSTWQVPLRWFVVVAPEERRLVLGRRRRDEERSLLYRAPMAQSRRRVARALVALRRGLDEGPAVTGVEDLGRWLEEFHPRSVVEVDYGGLVDLLDDESLRADESARDVAEALARLSEGDVPGAGEAYDRAVVRWRGIAAREHEN